MQRTLRLVVAYDGTGLHGWQRQAGVRSVQAELEDVCRRVLREPVAVVGASRTDAGVHARGQVAHLRTETAIPVPNLHRAIDGRLPADISLVHVREVPADFDARRDAVCKLYRYRIFNAPRQRRPVQQHAGRYAWHVWFPLDLERMRAAAAHMIGTRDYSAFATTGSPRESNVRTVRRISMRRRLEELRVDVIGDGFLYRQVRNMVGTLVEVGRGHWAPERVSEILASRERAQAGPTAPAHGLSLEWIQYPPLRSAADGA